ncbi:hypothetical protein ACH5RR_003371 [Cinchona calisaya]|uniref:Histone H2A/H2B/H3 domain-containing protein n=1 Tax=Cinchona calisaya TaxID=153742 RepID=A0ABD3AUL2_9GENT
MDDTFLDDEDIDQSSSSEDENSKNVEKELTTKTLSVRQPSPAFAGLPSLTAGRQQADCSSNSIPMGSDHSIGCASNNVEEIEELLGNENDMTALKKKRGPTCNIALSKKRKAAAGVKTKVDVSKESRRVIRKVLKHLSQRKAVSFANLRWKWRMPEFAQGAAEHGQVCASTPATATANAGAGRELFMELATEMTLDLLASVISDAERRKCAAPSKATISFVTHIKTANSVEMHLRSK